MPRPHLPRLHLHVPRPRLHLRMPPSPVRALVAFVSRWRGGRATLSLESRRARSMLIGAIVLAGVVLLTSFPIEGLLTQRSALSGAAHELSTVQAENNSLARQVSDLRNPATVNAIARLDYGFVPKGQRVFDILPAPDPSGATSSGSGQVPLSGPPVAPGSARSQALIGVTTPPGGVGTPSATTGGRSGGSGAVVTGQSPEPPEPHSYWGRVLRSLEFWT
ncbi:MAG: septum formation initiator family protein [Acidimicrobiales bacterium]